MLNKIGEAGAGRFLSRRPLRQHVWRVYVALETNYTNNVGSSTPLLGASKVCLSQTNPVM